MNPPDLADRIVLAIWEAKQQAALNAVVFTRGHAAEVVRSMLPAKAVRVKPPLDERASQIYAAYPRKVGPEDAKRAITVCLKTMKFEMLLERTTQYAAAVRCWPRHIRYNKDGVDTVPHPSTWYRRGSYNDDQREWHKGRSSPPPEAVPGVADNQTEPTVDWRAAAMRAAEATHDPVIRESRIAAAVEQDWVTFGPQFRSAIWRELEVLNRNRNAADEILSRST